MGIVAELQNSSLSFQNPRQNTVFLPISNVFFSVMHGFQISFAFEFKGGSRRGLAAPSTAQLWNIGIVQNVVYEKIHFAYSDGKVFAKKWKQAALDSVALTNAPFYHDPVHIPACKLDPMLNCQKYISVMVPVRSVWYTTQGFGELLDPWSANGVSVQSGPATVDMIDEPRFGARMRRGSAIITKADHIVSFKAWLVAQRSKNQGRQQIEILAHVPEFSLVFWLRTKPRPGHLTIDVPPHRFGYYGTKGITRRIIRKMNQVRLAQIRMRSGAGGRRPVLQGDTANTRGRQWLQSQKLLPN